MSAESEHEEFAHQPLMHQFEDLDQQNECHIVGMWTFLVTEIMFFGALFLALAVYRSLHLHDFNDAHEHLNVGYGAFNTVVLLTSSFTMVLAVRAAMFGQRNKMLGFLMATILGAFIFLGVKTVEYKDKWDHHLIPGASFRYESVKAEHAGGENKKESATSGGGDKTYEGQGLTEKGQQAITGNINPMTGETVHQNLSQDGKQLFFCLYFIMTGLHAVHIIIGILIMGVIGLLYVFKNPAVEDYMPLEMTGLYWHFVDIVWIFLFPLLYLVGGH